MCEEQHDPNDDLRIDAWTPEDFPESNLDFTKRDLFRCKIASDSLDWNRPSRITTRYNVA